MKKVFLALLILALFSFAACDNGSPVEQTSALTSESYTETPSSEPTPTTRIEDQEPTKKPIDPNKVIENSVLGIEVGNTSPDELLKKLEKLGLSIIKDENGNDKIYRPDLNDGRIRFCFKTEAMTFYYDRSETLVSIAVTDPSIATEKGIRIGDSFEKLKKVYGEPDRTDPEEAYLYYTNGTIFLEFINDCKSPIGVANWSVYSGKPIFFIGGE
jgi:hypothetical protein